MRYILVITLILLLGCSKSSINTNANVYVKNKVEKNLRASAVKTYSNQEIWQLGGTQLGYVETNYCQVEARDKKPSNHTFISTLKVKAQKLGGNALVFDSCVVHRSSARCHSTTQCRGIAYNVTYN